MILSIPTLDIAATLFFALAIIHTFLVKFIHKMADRFSKKSFLRTVLHLLSEVEVVFGFWALVFIIFFSFHSGLSLSMSYLTSRNMTEPAFVFVIMTICASKPILECGNLLIEFFSRLLPLKKSLSFFISALIIGPILGSFITEPAAMTITALVLLERFYLKPISIQLKYAIIGLLFVNISIGGTLTPYAAPPVLMVARVWNWDLTFMLSQFGWKAFLAVVISTLTLSYKFKKELMSLSWEKTSTAKIKMPLWIYFVHLLILILTVISSHEPAKFFALFILFLAVFRFTTQYQDQLRWQQGLMVGFFLAGLVALGGPQRWWLEPILVELQSWTLYLGAIALTAITDNAALTYLGSQVPHLSDSSKYALVAGSVVGGGLTVIANAPNPAGYGILNLSFGKNGISAWSLFKAALWPTFISALCFWFL